MGLFKFIENRLCDVLDVVNAGLDAAYEPFCNTLDRLGDVVADAADIAAGVECHVKCAAATVECNVKNIVDDVKFGNYDCIKDDVIELIDNIGNVKIELTNDIREALDCIDTFMGQVNFIKKQFNVAHDEAVRLAADYALMYKRY